jgi:hypothetical protein
MRQPPGFDKRCGPLSLGDTLALLLWMLAGLWTMVWVAVAASRFVTIALPL